MGKGRPRKQGRREPNGQLQRPTQDALNELNARQIRENTKVVRMQPHRRGSDHPWLVCALGRFCRSMGCSEDVYDGVSAYAETVRRWRIAKGVLSGLERTGGAGCGTDPTPEQVERWFARMNEIRTAGALWTDVPTLELVDQLALDDRDLQPHVTRAEGPKIVRAMYAMAEAAGCAVNKHPFA